ncbi:MAG TPA: EAL domain-containing protein [Paraburkholderia sp.]|jgi:EAL domain-containing protein (putative c-di-GMP-specific phosphodiesterase class I)|nr:EAL domain-containing protein [Paraburkholderia sp.]
MNQEVAGKAAKRATPMPSGCSCVASGNAAQERRVYFCEQYAGNERARHARIESALRDALAERELALAWQPVVDRVSDRTVCAEALLRWTHRELGIVPPALFVPIAERAGLIERVGDWVIDEACAQAARWRRHAESDLCVAVNVSPLQLNRRFVRKVSRVLELSGLPPSALELEITESRPMFDTASVVSTIAAIANFGVKLVIDDFGTGYSSLSYLRRLPVHGLKIDRSFVMGLPHEGRSALIVEGLTKIAHAMELTVTAEGVETNEQAAFLRECGVDRMQGFLFSRALDPGDFIGRYGTLANRRE